MSKPTEKSDSLRRTLIGRHTALISRFATVEAVSQRKILRGAVAKKTARCRFDARSFDQLMNQEEEPVCPNVGRRSNAIVVRKLWANPSAGKIHTQSKSKAP